MVCAWEWGGTLLHPGPTSKEGSSVMRVRNVRDHHVLERCNVVIQHGCTLWVERGLSVEQLVKESRR